MHYRFVCPHTRMQYKRIKSEKVNLFCFNVRTADPSWKFPRERLKKTNISVQQCVKGKVKIFFGLVTRLKHLNMIFFYGSKSFESRENNYSTYRSKNSNENIAWLTTKFPIFRSFNIPWPRVTIIKVHNTQYKVASFEKFSNNHLCPFLHIFIILLHAFIPRA